MGSKDTRQLIRELERQGWLIRLAKSGHYRAMNPATGATVTIPCTPGRANRSAQNNRAWLRKAGAEL
jgi:predicted RNA binding protein YcfA (HicA-like mRNA interferase family)